MQQPKKPAPTPRQVYTVQQPRPLPFQLQPAPKPGQGAAKEPLTLAEWANIGKELISTYAQMRQGYRLIDQAKQRQNQLIAEVNARLGNEGVPAQVCGLCGLPHVGEC